MKRFTHLTLALGTVVLLALLLFLAMDAQPTALAVGDTIKVPDDYSTIQEAIDAATDGDTILVAKGIYTENLSITEGITLSGGWNDDFITRNPTNSIINANRMGRAISITCPTSDTVVTIDGFFIVGGDASGQGVLEMPEMPDIPASKDLPYGFQTPPAVPASDSISPTEQAAQLRAGLADLEARGLYPGGEPAYLAMLDRLERVTAVAVEAQARADASPIQQQGQSQQGAGSGGGIYSYNASLVLQNNSIRNNVASQEGDGLGGAVYVAQAPSGGVRIISNFVADNVATNKGHGMGGALYVSDAPGATINNNHIEANVASNEGKGHGGGIYVANASQVGIDSNTLWSHVATGNGAGLGGGIYVMQAPDTIVGNNDIQDNIASSYGDGQGGGIYVIQSSGTYIQDNTLTRNLGSNAGAGSIGFGGGLAVESSPDVLVRNNQVEGNFASANWHSGSGAGGGFYLHNLDGVVVRDNSLNENVGTLKGNGGAGGLYLGVSQNALVEDNVVTGNWGGLFQFHIGQLTDDIASGAGGIGVVNAHNAIVRGNEIRENIALAYGVLLADVTGGGIDGRGLFDTQLIDNVITGNVACQMDCDEAFGKGGGVYLASVRDVVVAGNTLADNAASLLDGNGSGGGLYMFDANDSQVLRNRFLRNRGGMEGGAGGGFAIGRGPYLTDQSFTVDANLFLGNLGSPDPSVASSGGAVSISGISLEGGLSFTNNVLAGNRANFGGGLELDSVYKGTLTNNTLYDNGKTGVLVTFDVPDLTLTNNIIVSHTVGISVTEGATATVSYTLWDDNDTDIGGSGAISNTHPVYGAPAFVDPSNNDYHLAVGSPAIDAGDPAGVPPAPDHDYDGVARPQGMAVDIGADEWQGHYQYLPLVMNKQRPVIGWAAGEIEDGYGVIIYTTDGGETWVRQGGAGEIPNANLAGVAAIDANNAWVVGEQGTILRTRNGGLSWQQQEVPTEASDAGLCGIYAVDSNTAWVGGAMAAGSSGIILHTTDGGHTWTRQGQDLALTAQLCGAYASDEDHAWVVGGTESSNKYGTILRTSNAGETWERVPYTPAHSNLGAYLISVHGYGASPVWAVGNGQALRSVDGGVTWDDRTPGGGIFDVNGVYVVDHDTLWVVVDDGGIYRSDDSGAKWVQQTVPPGTTGDYILRISAVDKQSAWAVTAADPTDPSAPGHVLHTADGGQTWIAQTTPVSPSFWGVSFVGAGQ